MTTMRLLLSPPLGNPCCGNKNVETLASLKIRSENVEEAFDLVSKNDVEFVNRLLLDKDPNEVVSPEVHASFQAMRHAATSAQNYVEAAKKVMLASEFPDLDELELFVSRAQTSVEFCHFTAIELQTLITGEKGEFPISVLRFCFQSVDSWKRRTHDS
jgi:hypothetical protein